MLEQMSSSVDRLTDVAGKQTHHIENLWEEIGQKQNPGQDNTHDTSSSSAHSANRSSAPSSEAAKALPPPWVTGDME